MKLLTPLVLFALLAAGCPEQLGDLCPKSTTPVGQFALTLSQLQPGDACEYSTVADGGGLVDAGPLGTGAAGTSSIELCAGAAPDGGVQLLLAAPGKATRTSDVGDGGTFAFVTQSDVGAGGTACTCGLHVVETVSGVLNGGFTTFRLQADGGLPEIAGFDGGLVDALSTDAGPLADGGSPCTCNLPCEIAYVAQARRQ